MISRFSFLLSLTFSMTGYTPESIVKLNVGGASFATFYKTLTQSNFFENILAENALNSKTMTSNTEIFIDRSGKLFTDILYYLRTHSVFANEIDTLCLLREEAKYYQLEEAAEVFEQEMESLSEIVKQKTSATILNADDLKCAQGKSNYIVLEDKTKHFCVYKVLDVMNITRACRVHNLIVCRHCVTESRCKLLLQPTNKQLR